MRAGYEEAILLDAQGFVSEGTGENIFVVLDGVIHTPPQTSGILDGITRDAVIRIARDEGFEVLERSVARAELTLADELFMTGTAAELTPIREIDDHVVGDGVRRTGHDAAAEGLPRRAARPRAALPRVERRRRRRKPESGRVVVAPWRTRTPFGARATEGTADAPPLRSAGELPRAVGSR